jgi:hypothetical protein
MKYLQTNGVLNLVCYWLCRQGVKECAEAAKTARACEQSGGGGAGGDHDRAGGAQGDPHQAPAHSQRGHTSCTCCTRTCQTLGGQEVPAAPVHQHRRHDHRTRGGYCGAAGSALQVLSSCVPDLPLNISACAYKWTNGYFSENRT